MALPQSGCQPWRGSACSYRWVPSKRARPNGSAGKCDGTQSRITPRPRWWRWSTNRMSAVGRSVAGGRCVVAGGLVAPRPVERVLHHRQQLDVGEAVGQRVVGDRLGEGVVGRERAVAVASPPRTEVDLVDAHRGVGRLAAEPRRHPLVVAPAVGEVADDRRRCPAAPRWRWPGGRTCRSPSRRRRAPGSGSGGPRRSRRPRRPRCPTPARARAGWPPSSHRRRR